MNLKQITVKNFRCYEEKTLTFHEQFNLIVGQNATGKTTVLDAISVAIATLLLGFKHRKDKKSIESEDSMLRYVPEGGHFVDAWPVSVKATASCYGIDDIVWERSKESPTGNTRYGEATQLISIAKMMDANLAENEPLPLISYYGTIRLWQDPRQAKIGMKQLSEKPSRLDGYKHCVDPRIAVRELVAWFAIQEWAAYQDGKQSVVLTVVKNAVLSCIENAEEIRYHAKRKELLLTIKGEGPHPFNMLSDGQRCILALVADIAQKAVSLNGYMGEEVLNKTEGIVLIDELDLHLHPRWQRRVIEDLRRTFPKIQFICSTHSPFLIQSLRSGEELIMLDGQPTAELANKTLEDIAVGIMAVNKPDTSKRYDEMKGVATEYLKALENSDKIPSEKLSAFKERLAESIAPYADNPAYQAFLEMRRVATLKE
ncbi:TPA: AAA family ATPase [Providencia alcalifaciens]